MDGSERATRVAVIGGRDIDALAQVIRGLPRASGLSIVVMFPEQALADQLRSISTLPVVEVRDRTMLEPETLFVIDGGREAYLDQGALVLDGPLTVAPLDRILRSVSEELGANGTAVILGGHGTDGSLGVKRLKEVGGLTIAQTPSLGASGEMPRAAIATGAIDFVLAPSEIPGHMFTVVTGPVTTPDEDPADLADTLRDLLTLVRVRTGHDFSAYKRATLFRRVSRRMQVCGVQSLHHYLQHAREHPAELSSLLRDFLISVTNFFRDPDTFDALEAAVIPRLFDGKLASDQVRVWVAGCATGEEAYSIAMLLAEHVAQRPEHPALQVFATDIDEASLAEARAGRYPASIVTDVTPARLERFFVPEGEGYRVAQELREMVLFSPHNLLRDPPFSRLDLVTCRNLLIYLNREAQERVLTTFHFALRPEGRLFLGSSETPETAALFSALDLKNRIFGRRVAQSMLGPDMQAAGRWSARIPVPPSRGTERPSTFGEMHHRIVEYYGPPSILVNEDLDIVHLSEHAGKFIEPSGGEPTRQLLRIILPSLRLELRSAVYAARQSNAPDIRNVRFEDNGRTRTIEMRVRKADLGEVDRGMLLVTLDEKESSTEPVPPHDQIGIEPVVHAIEEELHRTRDQLRTTIEQYETSLEELKASNEELQAINEELRSATEELETSKEELQSVNEELTTLNHELKAKVDEVSHANNDLQNLMSSTQIGVVFLDRALNLKRFTPRIAELYNVIPTDLGRPFAHVTHQLSTDELPQLAQRVLQDLHPIEREIATRAGLIFLVRLLPYRSLEDRIEGVVITFVDVSDLRLAQHSSRHYEAALHTSEARLRMALHESPVIAISFDREGEVTWGFVRGKELAATGLANIFAPGHGERFVAIAREVAQDGRSVRLEVEVLLDAELRTYDFRFERSADAVSAVGFDITPSKRAELALRDADRRKDEFLATLSHELRNPLTPLKVALDVARLAEHDPVRLAEARAIMERQVAQLTHLVDELLDLSRITQGKLELELRPLDPALVVEAALQSTRSLVLQHRHELRVELPASSQRVIGDLHRLTQVLVNLLTNAIKYTPDAGRIDVLLEVDPARERLVMRVRDTGIGIDAGMLPQIFDIFVQCRDDTGRAKGGLGIGLNVVRRLVELHGGAVAASSAGLGKGSEFTVELPLAPRN
ncbi:MAG: CheR family methyltransferase [Kofleriaceae bacterium]